MTSALARSRSETDGWTQVVCPRIGAAPLQFLGRLLDGREVVVGAARLFVRLYRRKAGGVTVALSRLTDCGAWVEHAFRADDLAAAIQALEAYCTDLDDELDGFGPRKPEGIDMLPGMLFHRGRLAWEVGQFRHLAGEALDVWDSDPAAYRADHGGVR